MAETLREFLKKVENLPPETLVCVAEVDEAFAANVAQVEIVEDARTQSRKADGTETVELANGSEKVVVIRW
ncbi:MULTISPECIES: sugar phosphorylase [Microvirga]|uniref:sugar phosphorylase n=1 Tax=Microvirga TaxID=186650 RepID=UPI001CFFFC7D|nr:sugar phosphorylase [Microvirga lenta]MCB5177675.1 sugar phosphorylase [Microvirga lenta]